MAPSVTAVLPDSLEQCQVQDQNPKSEDEIKHTGAHRNEHAFNIEITAAEIHESPGTAQILNVDPTYRHVFKLMSL